MNAVIDIYRENWDEGTDTKQKAYQRLRQDKNKMFEENKIWKKYTSLFKGLKRVHPRAKKPNKITEYEVPRDPTKFNKKIDDFDPSLLFDMEYAKDEQKKKDREDIIWGPPPLKTKKEIKMDLTEDKVKVKHLNDGCDRVLSIFEELSQQLDNDKRQSDLKTKSECGDHPPKAEPNAPSTEQAASYNSFFKQGKEGDLTERTYKARLTMFE